MKIIWNDDSIRWFHAASEYTKYPQVLADFLLKYIPHQGTLCDMGCGTGLIDFELASHFSQITCVDISSEVISHIKKECVKRNICNINVLCTDGCNVSESFDTVIALFHGGPNIFENYYPLAKQQLIIVTHLGKSGTFGPKKYQKNHRIGAETTMKYLDEQHIFYHYFEKSIEYGQPFSDMEDAYRFIEAYGSKHMTEDERKHHLLSRIQKTDDSKYPYYLPNLKNMGIFIINRNEN